MTKRLTGLLLFSALILWGCSKKDAAPVAGPAAPVSASSADYKDAVAAVQAAKSWRMVTVVSGGAHGPEQSEFLVACPDRVKMIVGQAGAQLRMVSIGSDSWVSMDGTENGPWTKATANSKPICGADSKAFPAAGLHSASPRKGDRIVVNGQRCQEWIASAADDKGNTSEYTVCVGEDNLPLQIKSTDGSVVTFSGWNATTVEKPANAS